MNQAFATVIDRQQKRRLQEGEDVGAGTPLSSGSGGSEQQPTAGSDPDHDADSDDALKPSEPKRLRAPLTDVRVNYGDPVHCSYPKNFCRPAAGLEEACYLTAANKEASKVSFGTPPASVPNKASSTSSLDSCSHSCSSCTRSSPHLANWRWAAKDMAEWPHNTMKRAANTMRRYGGPRQNGSKVRAPYGGSNPDANKRRRNVTFSLGDSVLLSTKNLRNAPGRARKFLPRYVGPFKVTGKLGEAAYRLELPPTMSRLHPVFHVSLLKKYAGSQGFHPPPVMEWLEDAPHYEVHSLLSHRQVRFKKRMEYLVKWTGYDDTYNTWEPEAMLAGAPQILSRYKAVHNLP
ncbi:hypothetical protein QJQ45_015691 [Haematococcus lacustris]|nr:hypothetical protein QJQ45_015691 [Haematococcus lacustris]